MKTKTDLSYLYVITVLTFAMSLLLLAVSMLPNAEPEWQLTNKQNSQILGSGVSVELRQSPKIDITATQTVIGSCYTSRESHGAVGRNKWSVATYLYPIGTKLWVEGFGEKIVETRTAKRYANRLDIWFGDDYEACLDFGVRKLKVRIIN